MRANKEVHVVTSDIQTAVVIGCRPTSVHDVNDVITWQGFFNVGGNQNNKKAVLLNLFLTW